MSKSSKTIKKMRSNPRDWCIDQLEIIAQRYGVKIRKTGGSHVVFEHPSIVDMVCVPAHRPIKPIYIKRFLQLIDKLEANNE